MSLFVRHGVRVYRMFELCVISSLILSVCLHAQAEPPSSAAGGTPSPEVTATPSSTPATGSKSSQVSASSSSNSASSSMAYLLRTTKGEAVIKDLQLSSSAVPIILLPKDNEIKPTIAVQGTFVRKGWRLFVVGGTEVLPSDFVIYAHLKGRVNEVTMIAVGPQGEKEIEKIYVYSPGARTFQVVSAWEDLLFSTGLAGFSYSQSGFGVFQAAEIVLAIRYQSPDSESRFGYLLSGEMTVLGMGASPVSTSPQLFEAKGDLTIRLNKTPWRRVTYRGLLGATYLTMFSNGSPFGFSDLLATQAGLQGRYIANVRDEWIGEFRYLPVGGMSDYGQYAFNVSLALSRLLPNSRRAELALCYSFYDWLPDSVTRIQTSLLTLRIGLTL